MTCVSNWFHFFVFCCFVFSCLFWFGLILPSPSVSFSLSLPVVSFFGFLRRLFVLSLSDFSVLALCMSGCWLACCMPLWCSWMFELDALVGPVSTMPQPLLNNCWIVIGFCSDSRRMTTSPVVHAKAAIARAFGEPSKDWAPTSDGSRNNPLHSPSPSEEETTLPVWAAKITKKQNKKTKENNKIEMRRSKPNWFWEREKKMPILSWALFFLIF